ncbi:MAG: phage major capsid protein [Chloroflexota bacterium]
MTAPTIPTTPAELEEALSDGGRVAAMITAGQFGEFVTNYARVVLGRDADIGRQVRDETQRTVVQFIRDNPDAVLRPNLNPGMTQPRTPAAKCAAYNPRAAGAAVDRAFEVSAAAAQGGDGEQLLSVAGRFLRHTWHGAQGTRSSAMRAELSKIKAAFGSTIPGDGGFLIPEVLRSQLLSVALESSVVRPRAMVVPMDSLTVPFPAIDATSNASSVYGGIVAYWTEEGGALVQSSAKFSRVQLTAKKLTAYTEVPNELFTDAIISLEAFINEKFPEAIAHFEDIAFMRGTGAGEPLGFMHAENAAAVSVAKEVGQAAATILWENIVKMYARMLPGSLSRAVWVAHIDTFPELATMALSVGTGGSAIWLNNGTEGPPMTILGRPVVFTEKASTVGTKWDISFVDLGYYLIGDRMAIQSATSPHYKFANDVTAMRFIERVDGRPWIQSAITPVQGANTLSPFVNLATRS